MSTIRDRDPRNAPRTRDQAQGRIDMARVILRQSPFPEDRQTAQDEIEWMTELLESGQLD